MTIADTLARLARLFSHLADRAEPWLPNDGTLIHWSLYAWLLCLLCLSPALLRIAMLRPRRLDPIWGLVAMLAMNRLSFLLRISPQVSHATAIALAVAMALLSISYQASDRAAAR